MTTPTRCIAGWLVFRMVLAPAPVAAAAPGPPAPPPSRACLASAPPVPAAPADAPLAVALDALELARTDYLGATAESHRLLGSVRSFARSVARLQGGDPAAEAAALRSAEARRRMTAGLAALEGADPLLAARAREAVNAAEAAAHACGERAADRRRTIVAGAGGVAGLIGAAGVVVAVGATGTMGGGVVIAAALEASLAAYLLVRTERGADAAEPGAGDAPEEPELPEPEERRFRPADRDGSLRRGDRGDGQGEDVMDTEQLAWDEWSGGEGEGDEFEGEDGAPVEPRESLVPAELPPEPPEEPLGLPPLLDPARLAELRTLPLDAVQARLDEFLALAPEGAAERAPAPPLRSALVAELIAEAGAALRAWEQRRELSPGFGEFFVRAELEEVPESRRAGVWSGAHGRFAGDREAYAGARHLEELRRRIAARLVTHCRAEPVRGDLVQAACQDETALSILVVAAVQGSGVALPGDAVLGVQSAGGRFHPVLFHPGAREVRSLISGDVVRGVVAPIYHPASFYYSFLVEHGVRPEIDPERHLRIAAADPGMELPDAACAEGGGRNVFGRVVDWFRSLVGAGIPSRRGDPCAREPAGWPGGQADGADPGDSAGRAGATGAGGAAGGAAADSAATDGETRRSGVSVSVSMPRIPRPTSGGGQSGGGGQGGGGSGGGADGAGSRGGGSSAAAGGTRGGGSGRDAAGSERGGQGRGAGEGSGTAGQGGGSQGPGGSGGRGGGTAASGGGGVGGSGTDLGEVARETAEMRDRHRDSGALRVRPWRLRADYGYVAPSARVLFADNDQALSRFEAEETFITLSPSDDEAQRRMLEADSFPVFPAATTCESRGLPPRRVLRRAADAPAGFRYLFCDQDESTVIFRGPDDARTYAALGAPDRPLFLVRLASERLRRLEASPEVARLRALLADPDGIRALSAAELDDVAEAAGALLTFQATLESALVQSMEELAEAGGTVRPHYYELHRQVLQGPLFVELAAASYRFNRRLASDPLRSLAWADALPEEARRGFFHLYYLLGSPVHWPARWEALAVRYGGVPAAAGSPEELAALDFLQILGDPSRVRVDWEAERRSAVPSIRDRRVQRGRERTPEQRPDPSDAVQREREERTERTRGGTGGRGRTGQGDGQGPERGRQPLQIVNIRIAPADGEPDLLRLPADNATRPGGTRGRRRTSEESATRQEPVLWLAPQTFVDAALSAWGRERGGPGAASRVPPVLRLDRRLRGVFLREMDRGESYDGRLMGVMRDFSAGGWLRYREAREAMGGEWVGVRALDTGRFAAKYARSAPIRDAEQIRTPNFFTRSGVVIPADLFEPLRRRYARGDSPIFDLAADGPTGEVLELRDLPLGPDDADGSGRAGLLRALEMIREGTR